ncbi:hypothetical protein, partial [Escherichia coli]|uniref:hypothetical protein n=1 Tax=Escherichia coli TaxID=562 RepID=UPI001B8D7E9D
LAPYSNRLALTGLLYVACDMLQYRYQSVENTHRSEMLNYPQLRERSVVLLVGNLLKESSMEALFSGLSLDQIS